MHSKKNLIRWSGPPLPPGESLTLIALSSGQTRTVQTGIDGSGEHSDEFEDHTQRWLYVLSHEGDPASNQALEYTQQRFMIIPVPLTGSAKSVTANGKILTDQRVVYDLVAHQRRTVRMTSPEFLNENNLVYGRHQDDEGSWNSVESEGGAPTRIVDEGSACIDPELNPIANPSMVALSPDSQRALSWPICRTVAPFTFSPSESSSCLLDWDSEEEDTYTAQGAGFFASIFELPTGPATLLFPAEFGDLNDPQWHYDPGGSPFRDKWVDLVEALGLNRQGHVVARIRHHDNRPNCELYPPETGQSLVYYNPSESRPFIIQRFDGGYIEDNRAFINDRGTIAATVRTHIDAEASTVRVYRTPVPGQLVQAQAQPGEIAHNVDGLWDNDIAFGRFHSWGDVSDTQYVTWTTPNPDLPQPTWNLNLLQDSLPPGIQLASVDAVAPNTFAALRFRDATGQDKLGFIIPGVELESRDRCVVGTIHGIRSWENFDLKIEDETNGKDYGTYAKVGSDSRTFYVYESEGDIFNDAEMGRYQGGSLDPKSKNQDVVFVKDGDKIKFYTTFDKLGKVKASIQVNGQTLGSVTHQLTEEQGFDRLIWAIEKCVAGDAPPPIAPVWTDLQDPPPITTVTVAGGSSEPSQRNLLGSIFGNVTPPTKEAITFPDELRNRNLVTKVLIPWAKRVIKTNVASGEGLVFGIWDGLTSDVEGVVDTLRLPLDFVAFLQDPWKVACELYNGFKVVSEMGLSDYKAIVADLFDKFLTQQATRLEWALGADAQDPAYLTSYMGGYLTGYIGEQIAVTIFTAGAAKAGWIGKVLKEGKQVLTKTLTDVEKYAREMNHTLSRYVRSANEGRAVRRTSSQCRTPGGCFAAGTQVVMADRSLKRIDDIRTGDWVLSDDPFDDKPPFAVRVEGQFMGKGTRKSIVQLDSDNDGMVDASIAATSEHPFYTGNRSWVTTQNLSLGDRLSGTTGNAISVLSIEVRDESFVTYNLNVAGPNTFFVASGNFAILVHNAEYDIKYYPDPGDLGNELHHGLMNVWCSANYPEYGGRRDRTVPMIELTEADHEKTKAYYREWLRQRTGVPVGGQVDWKTVSPREMNALMEGMFDAAGIPDDVRVNYHSALNGWMHRRIRPFDCP